MNERHSTHESWVEPTPGGRTIDEQFLIVKKVPKNKFDVDRSEISIPMENVRKAVDGYWARPDIRALWLRSYPHDRELTHLSPEKRLHLNQLLWGVNLRVQDSADNWHTLSLTPDDREKLLTILYPKDGSPKNAFRRMDRRAGLKLAQFSGRGAIEAVEKMQEMPIKTALAILIAVDTALVGSTNRMEKFIQRLAGWNARAERFLNGKVKEDSWYNLFGDIGNLFSKSPATPESLVQSDTELALDHDLSTNMHFLMSPDTCRRVITISTTDGRQLNGFIYTTRTPSHNGTDFKREIYYIITDRNVSTVLDAMSSPKGNDARPIDVLLAETFGYMKKEFNGDTYAPYEGDALKQQINRFLSVPVPPTQQEMEPITIENEELRLQTEVELDSTKTRQELFLESPDHCRRIFKVHTEASEDLYGFAFTARVSYEQSPPYRVISVWVVGENDQFIFDKILKITPDMQIEDAIAGAYTQIDYHHNPTGYTILSTDAISLIDHNKKAGMPLDEIKR